MKKATLNRIIHLIKQSYQYRVPDVNNISIDCPFCGKNDHKYHLAVGTKVPAYKCWKCGSHGSLYKLLEVLGLSDASDGTEYLYGGREEESLYDEIKVKEYSELILPDEYVPLYKDTKSIVAKEALAYLYNRGIGPDKIEKYKLGFCPVGFYGSRIIIPTYDSYDKLRFYVGRSFYPNVTKKVLNPPRDKYGVGSGDVIFNIQNNIGKDTIIINEGVFDAMTLDSIALFGKLMSDRQFEILKDTKASSIVVMLDPDALTFAYEIAERLYPYKKVFICNLPENEDPSSLGFEKTMHLLEDKIEFSPASKLLFDLRR